MYFYYGADGTPMAMSFNGVRYYYVTSLQGDITAIVDQNGTVVTTYLYDAWGNHLNTTGSLSATVGRYNPLRYRGYVYDRETNLYYLRSRYYNPETGRFINADGLVSTGQGVIGNNMFAYCNNNPVMLVDLTGRCPILKGTSKAFEWFVDIAETVIRYISKTSDNTSKPLTAEEKHFISVVAGEAIGENAKTQKAVAHTIMNRVKEPRDSWCNVTSVSDVLVSSQYKAVGGTQYNLCMEYLNNRNGNSLEYENLIAAVLPIYWGEEADFTGGAHFIFNVHGSAKLLRDLEAQPDRYVKCGPFDDISDTKYRMYRCLW